ncbi:MAG: hypothetical protein SOY42_13700 [Clostridium sp.]|nr:hypothetical protein [Clostridium sp.]
MNGEIEQMSNIIISTRKAIHNKEKIEYSLDKYIASIKFIFLSRGKFIKKTKIANSVSDWFDICKKQGLEDIKFIIPISVKDRYILGFSNTSQDSMVCFWNDKSITYFTSRWKYDSDNQGWKVVYEEHEWKDAPRRKTSFVNHTEEFKQVLLDIETLANRIDFENFAKIFHRAYESLCGYSYEYNNNLKVNLPDAFRGIYLAIMEADVFGAMGSWNDSPPYYAHEKGLDKEYDELSNKLLEQLRYNLMYVVNECWN